MQWLDIVTPRIHAYADVMSCTGSRRLIYIYLPPDSHGQSSVVCSIILTRSAMIERRVHLTNLLF